MTDQDRQDLINCVRFFCILVSGVSLTVVFSCAAMAWLVLVRGG